MKFPGKVADFFSDAQYKAIVGRSFTGGDTIILTSISTGTSIPLVAVYYTGTKTVRAIQVSDTQSSDIDVRFCIIATKAN